MVRSIGVQPDPAVLRPVVEADAGVHRMAQRDGEGDVAARSRCAQATTSPAGMRGGK